MELFSIRMTEIKHWLVHAIGDDAEGAIPMERW